MFYCNELPFGVISPNTHLNIETINIIYSYNEDETALFETEMTCEKYYEETPKEYVSLAIKSLEQNR